MTFQSTIPYDFAYGVPGDLRFDGPLRVSTGLINSASAAYNIVGATYFTTNQSAGTVQAGNPASGTVVGYGILCNPKAYASFGNSTNGPLGPTMTLANFVQAEFINMGFVVVTVPGASNIGDIVEYNNTTGALKTLAPGSSADSGFTLIPNAEVWDAPQTNSGGGIVLLKLTA
jgi:hypothetical protein